MYTEIDPDEQGWIYSVTNDVWIGVTRERDSFFVVDARTGERILPAEEAERRMQALEAELARVREELARARQGVED